MRKILHITPHLGGGVGTVIKGWMERVEEENKIQSIIESGFTASERGVFCKHDIMCLERLRTPTPLKYVPYNEDYIPAADIVVVHYWDQPVLAEMLSRKLPPSRMVFWCHKNYKVPPQAVEYPDLFVDTSPAQGNSFHIWSTGGVEKYLNITRKEGQPSLPFPFHRGFNVGYIGWVDYKKMHPHFMIMSDKIDIPEVKFIVCGEVHPSVVPRIGMSEKLVFTGQIDDVPFWLSKFDVFGYPLRHDHFGTCEQVLGEAMAAGVVPVVMDNAAENYIIEDGVSGFIAKNEREYIGCIEFLYRYPAIRLMMSHEARMRARKLYSMDTMVNDWDAVFDNLMEKPKNEKLGLNY